MDKTLERTKLQDVQVPAMGGTYNKADVYPRCDRGVEFFFKLEPGPPYNATATLEETPDPTFVLKITANGQQPDRAMYREVLPTEPASAFGLHAQLKQEDYPANTEVPVKVTVAASGEVQVQRS
jgi:hypothetical protein